MSVLSKHELIHGEYYEGTTVNFNEPRTARWNAKTNLFEYMLHHWSDIFFCGMTYFTEPNDDHDAFKPLLRTKPRDFERIESYE